MSLGERIVELRKKKKISQSELANMVGIHTNVLGRYERGEAKTYVETATKLALALGVSLDYLVGNSDTELDQKTLNRISEISKLPSDEKEKVFMVIDALVRDFKAKQTYA